jgi:uncharacterized protein
MRKRFLTQLSLVSIITCCCLFGALYTADCQAFQQNRQPVIYLLAGGNFHLTEECADLLIQYLQGKTRYPVKKTMVRYDLTRLDELNAQGLILITQGGVLSDAELQSLQAFVRSGKGVVGIHGATDSFDDAGEVEAYTDLIGGWFQSHPPRGEFPVTVKNTSHPITREMKNFRVRYDERYVMKLADGLDVLLTVDVDGKEIPNTWTKDYGQGRVFYTGLGHDRTTFRNATFLSMVVRGIKWAIEDPAQ